MVLLIANIENQTITPNPTLWLRYFNDTFMATWRTRIGPVSTTCKIHNESGKKRIFADPVCNDTCQRNFFKGKKGLKSVSDQLISTEMLDTTYDPCGIPALGTSNKRFSTQQIGLYS